MSQTVLAEKSRTEVFGARGLDLAKKYAQKRRKYGFWTNYVFTDYVIVTPKGNPAGIRDLKDMAEPGVRVMLPLGASPPGSASVKGIMKLSGLTDGIMKNLMAESALCNFHDVWPRRR